MSKHATDENAKILFVIAPSETQLNQDLRLSMLNCLGKEKEDYDFDKFYPKIMSSERFGELEESVKIDKAGFFGDKTYRPGHKIVTEEEMNKMINKFGWFTSSKYVLGK